MAADGICQSRRAFSAAPEGRVVVLVLALWPHTEYASLGVLFGSSEGRVVWCSDVPRPRVVSSFERGSGFGIVQASTDA